MQTPGPKGILQHDSLALLQQPQLTLATAMWHQKLHPLQVTNHTDVTFTAESSHLGGFFPFKLTS